MADETNTTEQTTVETVATSQTTAPVTRTEGATSSAVQQTQERRGADFDAEKFDALLNVHGDRIKQHLGMDRLEQGLANVTMALAREKCVTEFGFDKASAATIPGDSPEAVIANAAFAAGQRDAAKTAAIAEIAANGSALTDFQQLRGGTIPQVGTHTEKPTDKVGGALWELDKAQGFTGAVKTNN